MILLCVGQMAMLQGMRGEEGVHVDIVEGPREELKPRSVGDRLSGWVRSLKDRIQTKLSSVPKKTGNQSGVGDPGRATQQPVVVEGDSSGLGDSVSAKQAAAIRNVGKPKVNFGEQLRSVFSRKKPQDTQKTFEELNKKIDEINDDISSLEALEKRRKEERYKKNVETYNMDRLTEGKEEEDFKKGTEVIENEIQRLLDVKKELQGKLQQLPEYQAPQQAREAARKAEQDEDQLDPQLAINRMRNSKEQFLRNRWGKTPEETHAVLKKEKAKQVEGAKSLGVLKSNPNATKPTARYVEVKIGPHTIGKKRADIATADELMKQRSARLVGSSPRGLSGHDIQAYEAAPAPIEQEEKPQERGEKIETLQKDLKSLAQESKEILKGRIFSDLSQEEQESYNALSRKRGALQEKLVTLMSPSRP
jgi:hypothetical protein